MTGKESKIKDLLTSLEQINGDLDFQIKHTARIAAIHQQAKDQIGYLKEIKKEKLERIKALEEEKDG